MARMIDINFIGIALASVLSAAPAHAQGLAQADGWAVRIPPSAMRALLHCRHQDRPEQECFARLNSMMAREQALQAQRTAPGAASGS